MWKALPGARWFRASWWIQLMTRSRAFQIPAKMAPPLDAEFAALLCMPRHLMMREIQHM